MFKETSFYAQTFQNYLFRPPLHNIVKSNGWLSVRKKEI